MVSRNVLRAIESLKKGEPVMIFDSKGREEEVDLVYYAPRVTWREINILRRLAGGLICYATRYSLLKRLGLKFLHEVLSEVEAYRILASRRLHYGDPPAFIVWINHRDVRTGISDRDRATTISALVKLTLLLEEDPKSARQFFEREFIVPGHVALLGARSLRERRGHTELSVTLAELAGLKPSVVFAEMLADDGHSLSLNDAEKLSKLTGIPLVTGDEILEAWWELGPDRNS